MTDARMQAAPYEDAGKIGKVWGGTPMALASVRHQQNLVSSMPSRDKGGAGPDTIA